MTDEWSLICLAAVAVLTAVAFKHGQQHERQRWADFVGVKTIRLRAKDKTKRE